jgi:hypothetical protein
MQTFVVWGLQDDETELRVSDTWYLLYICTYTLGLKGFQRLLLVGCQLRVGYGRIGQDAETAAPVFNQSNQPRC